MTVDEALRLTKMNYQRTGGGDDPAWQKFRQTMIDQSRTDPLEWYGPMLKALCRDFGRWVYADCEAEEVVIVYFKLQPFSHGLNRRIGVHTFDHLRRMQQQWDREGRD